MAPDAGFPEGSNRAVRGRPGRRKDRRCPPDSPRCASLNPRRHDPGSWIVLLLLKDEKRAARGRICHANRNQGPG